jgi:hypothetical protein
MEAVAVIAVVAVVCIIAGFKASTMLLAAIALIGLVFALITLFFVYFIIRLLFSKHKKGEFSRIDKSPYNRFNTAYYIIDGKEYPNVFPSEGVIESKLYKKGRTYNVMLDRRGKYVFDRFSITTCITGFIFCSVSVAGILMLYINF